MSTKIYDQQLTKMSDTAGRKKQVIAVVSILILVLALAFTRWQQCKGPATKTSLEPFSSAGKISYIGARNVTAFLQHF
ncbi:hypothetical protein EXU57_09300 [Segetibacter sp. 3557_3]|uniref:hypothetical protein n=1 Tax=Segetibacter sp. 3557_3 TaxID=2547429 RepID=UPI0010587646|nr:hypothetical protein [Segetibacter sp. 3557_3]TDH26989.1 hypothetical protein EXU57_09300 [Segetibacter sp. 3557_3]